MRRVFILLLLFLFVSPCFASDWFELNPERFVDLSSIKENGNIISAWFQELNPGHWELVKNKKVGYRLIRFEANCNTNKINISSMIFYDLKDNVITSYQFPHSEWTDVVPDSVGESKYQFLCDFKETKI